MLIAPVEDSAAIKDDQEFEPFARGCGAGCF